LLLGKNGAIVTDCAVIFQLLGSLVAYVNIIGALAAPVFELGAANSDSFLCSEGGTVVIQVLTSIFVLFPLCMVRSMDALGYTSFAALLFMGAFTVAVISVGVQVAIDGTSARSDIILGNGGDTNGVCDTSIFGDGGITIPSQMTVGLNADPVLLGAIPIMCFAYSCHFNVPPIYEALEGRSFAKMKTVCSKSILISYLVYAASGVFGYLVFLESTESNVVINFNTSGSTLAIVMVVLRAGFALAICFSFPLIAWEARVALAAKIFGEPLPKENWQVALVEDEETDFNWKEFTTLNVGIVAFATVLGVLIPPSALNLPLGIIGSTAAPVLIFILPVLMHRRLVKLIEEGSEEVHHENNLAGEGYSRMATALLCFGATLIPLCLGVTMWQATVEDLSLEQ
jgi:amino acid permease